MKNKIIALVFLYNYTLENIENIKSYSNQVDKVFAYDNTERENIDPFLKKKLLETSNIVYIGGNGNKGLSYPINLVGEKAFALGYKWMITFDQDSVANEEMIHHMSQFITTYPEINKIGIVSPIIKEKELKYFLPVYEYSYVDWVIQSGAMHNLEIFDKIKGYDKKIFIHQVDTEYCYRLMNNGYKIIRVNKSILNHNVSDDNVEIKYFSGKRIYLNKFSPERYYYIVRNNLYCIKKYGRLNPLFKADLINNTKVILITWFFDNNKIKRGKAILYGFFDFLFNKAGKMKRKI